jgi:hypothetical protein
MGGRPASLTGSRHPHARPDRGAAAPVLEAAVERAVGDSVDRRRRCCRGDTAGSPFPSLSWRTRDGRDGGHQAHDRRGRPQTGRASGALRLRARPALRHVRLPRNRQVRGGETLNREAPNKARQPVSPVSPVRTVWTVGAVGAVGDHEPHRRGVDRERGGILTASMPASAGTASHDAANCPTGPGRLCGRRPGMRPQRS